MSVVVLVVDEPNVVVRDKNGSRRNHEMKPGPVVSCVIGREQVMIWCRTGSTISKTEQTGEIMRLSN